MHLPRILSSRTHWLQVHTGTLFVVLTFVYAAFVSVFLYQNIIRAFLSSSEVTTTSLVENSERINTQMLEDLERSFAERRSISTLDTSTLPNPFAP